MGLLALALAGCIEHFPAPLPEAGDLVGLVTDAHGGLLGGAQVSVDGATAITDSLGRFVLADVAAGTRLLRVSAAGHAPVEEWVTLYPDRTTTIGLSVARAGESWVSASGGVIRVGEVTLTIPSGATWADASGEPVTGLVRVEVVWLDEPTEALAAPGDARLDAATLLDPAGFLSISFFQDAPVTLESEAVIEGPGPRYRWVEGAWTPEAGLATPGTGGWWAFGETQAASCLGGKLSSEGSALPAYSVEALPEGSLATSRTTTDLEAAWCVSVPGSTAELVMPDPARSARLTVAAGSATACAAECAAEETVVVPSVTTTAASIAPQLPDGASGWGWEVRAEDGHVLAGGEVDPELDCFDVPGGTTVAFRPSDGCHDWHETALDGTACQEIAVEAVEAASGTWYADEDGDGHGDAANAVSACGSPVGFVADATDCDDASAAVSPVATEICNDLDDDCDDQTDEPDAEDAAWWYFDGDGDGWGTSEAAVRQCEAPADHAALDGDCDDGVPGVNPGAEEICGADGVDEDCDGIAASPLSCGDLPSIIWPSSLTRQETRLFYGVSGGYSVAESQTLPRGGHRARVDDVDDDGHLDLLLLGYEWDSALYWGTAEGLDPIPMLLDVPGAVDAVIEDFDRNGSKDLFIAAHHAIPGGYTLTSAVYWGEDDWAEESRTELTTHGPYEVAAADLDKNGYTDLVVPAWSGTLRIFWGRSTGFSDDDVSERQNDIALGVALADVDGNGWVDVLYTSRSTPTLTGIWKNGPGGMGNFTSLGVTSQSVSVAELDGDDKPDIVLGGGHVFFGVQSSLPLETGVARDHEVVDFDDDGDLDLVFGAYDGWAAHLYYNDGAGGFSESYQLPVVGAHAVSAFDLDDNGYPELLFSNLRDAENDYDQDSYIYWGSAAGYSTEERIELPVYGPWGEPVLFRAP